MKTNFLQRNRPTQTNKKKILIVISIFIFGFIFTTLLKGSVLRIFSPLWQLRGEVLSEKNDLVSFFKSRNSLIEENKILKERLSSQEGLVGSFNALESIHDSLLAQTGNPPIEQKIAGGVISRPPQSFYDVITVDVGGESGINIGNKVILPFGALIGEVTKSLSKTSQITLFSTYGKETEAILERGEVPVTITGLGGGNFEIKIPRDISIEKDDRILSKGLDPRLLAIVKDVTAESTDSFKKVIAVTPTSIYSLRYVYIQK
ncbi:MAG: rod shape-determining protein MreC [bacterium]|nr:rod shape-determining protein MreC [bacterium]